MFSLEDAIAPANRPAQATGPHTVVP